MKSKLVAVTLGVFIAAVTAATGDANALVFCAKEGQPDNVRVRSGKTCKTNEAPVQLELPPGPEGPKGEKGDKGDTGEQGPPGVPGPQGGLVVRDSKDAVVGMVFSSHDRDFDPAGLTVVRQIEGHLVRFRVDQDGFVETPLWGFLYESADCTGTPLFYPRDKFLPTRLFIEGTTGSYPRDMAPRAADSSKGLNVESEGECTLSGTRPCVYNPRKKTCCCNWRGTIPAVEIQTTDLSTLGLVPPFRLDLP